MSLSETFLGVIAVGVLAMAIGQVMAVVMAARAMRTMGEAVGRLDRDLRPIIANVQDISAEAARASASAAAQVVRTERLLEDVSKRVEETMGTIQRFILGPARDGAAILSGIKAAVTAFRDFKSRPRTRPAPTSPVPVAVPDPGDDDHASFIG